MSERVVTAKEVKNYEDEWKRTNPDIVVYKPASKFGADSFNLHFCVTKSPAGTWLAFWTRGADEGEINMSMVVSRSTNRGATWSEPTTIDGKFSQDSNYQAPKQIDRAFQAPKISEEEGKRHAGIAYWGFPIIAPALNRIYCFYFKCNGFADFRYDIGGILTGRYSEDDGVTWSDAFELPIHRTVGDNPDPGIPVNWIIWQIPYVTSHGQVIAPFTCWNSAKSPLDGDSDAYFLRFDNILTEADPAKLTTTTLPESQRGLRVPSVFNPEISFCEEPAIVELSDGRLFCVMRTNAGYIAFSVSQDHGRTWSTPAPLYQDDDGDLMLNPVVPCPIWKLQDGRYLLLYCNNKGDANGGHFPCNYACHKLNRYPSFISVGREDLSNPRCPIRFGAPKVIVDNQGVPLGPSGRTDASSYSSLLEDGEDRVLFYPDREHFLLGKRLPDEWLADCDPG